MTLILFMTGLLTLAPHPQGIEKKTLQCVVGPKTLSKVFLLYRVTINNTTQKHKPIVVSFVHADILVLRRPHQNKYSGCSVLRLRTG